jgi:hypothetical protein
MRYSLFIRYFNGEAKRKKKGKKTYNSWDSLVVTHPTTNQPACGLSMAERTGSPVFHTLWSYVMDERWKMIYILRAIVVYPPIHRFGSTSKLTYCNSVNPS